MGRRRRLSGLLVLGLALVSCRGFDAQRDEGQVATAPQGVAASEEAQTERWEHSVISWTVSVPPGGGGTQEYVRWFKDGDYNSGLLFSSGRLNTSPEEATALLSRLNNGTPYPFEHPLVAEFFAHEVLEILGEQGWQLVYVEHVPTPGPPLDKVAFGRTLWYLKRLLRE